MTLACPTESRPRARRLAPRGQAQQPHGVGHRGAGFAHFLRDLLLGELEPADEFLVAQRFLDRIQILALQILDQREFDHFGVAGSSLEDGGIGEPWRSGARPPAALASDQLPGRHRRCGRAAAGQCLVRGSRRRVPAVLPPGSLCAVAAGSAGSGATEPVAPGRTRRPPRLERRTAPGQEQGLAAPSDSSAPRPRPKPGFDMTARVGSGQPRTQKGFYFPSRCSNTN